MGLSLAVNFFANLLFPAGDDPSQIMYQNIMNTLKDMQSQLAKIEIVGNKTYSELLSERLKDKHDEFVNSQTELNNLEANFTSLLNAIGEAKAKKYGDDFKSGKVDFNNSIDSVGLMKATIYLNANGFLDEIFSKDNMAKLEIIDQNFSNFADAQAYNQNGSHEQLNSGNNGLDINLIPNLMNALSKSIYDSEVVPRDNQKSYSYGNGKFEVNNNSNILKGALAYNDALDGLYADTLNSLIKAEKIEYVALIAHYLGGNEKIAVPDMIRTKLIIREHDLNEEIKTLEADKKNKASAIQADNLAKKRLELFNTAANLLSDSYKAKLEHLTKMIYTPSVNYVEFQTLVSSDTSGMIIPDWDFIRGMGKYGKIASYDEKLQAIKYKLTGNSQSMTTLNDLVNNGSIYWDGITLKTLQTNSDGAIIADSYLMQNIGQICKQAANKYDLTIRNNKVLSCSYATLNYENAEIEKLFYLTGHNNSTYSIHAPIDKTIAFNIGDGKWSFPTCDSYSCKGYVADKGEININTGNYDSNAAIEGSGYFTSDYYKVKGFNFKNELNNFQGQIFVPISAQAMSADKFLVVNFKTGYYNQAFIKGDYYQELQNKIKITATNSWDSSLYSWYYTDIGIN